jgi:HAD superfamily hydrolase (TIGR01549 family)
MPNLGLFEKCTVAAFDFDGVILDSSMLKSEVFKEIFSMFPEHFEHALSYHLSSKGYSRFIQINYFVKNILKKNDPLLIRNLLDEYKKRVCIGLLQADEISGARSLIEYLYGRNVPLYIISNAPNDELMSTLENLKLKQFFKKVYGNDKGLQKSDYLQNIANTESTNIQSIVFVGDTAKDQQAAKDTGCSFLGLKNELSNFEENYGHIINNFSELYN